MNLAEKVWSIEQYVNEKIAEVEKQLNGKKLLYTERCNKQCLLDHLLEIRSLMESDSENEHEKGRCGNIG